MWLLETSRAELKFFVSPESVPSPGFAILSHVWGDYEQTFQDIQALRIRCATTGENPLDLTSEKIRSACQLALLHGFGWLWVDTCCIDKTSSVELSEAINSMYAYYSAAPTCYAYLRDVHFSARFDHDLPVSVVFPRRISKCPSPSVAPPGLLPLELIAPGVVLFVSQTWEVLGSKADLAECVQEITGIPAAVLRLESDMSEFSIAQRMSWAARRSTTRLEDEAYCLLGIFDINMPMMYGEGKKAFRRLQEEILRKSMDTTLFAWGFCNRDKGGNWLFARSPSDFKNSGHIQFIEELTSARPHSVWRKRLGFLRRTRDSENTTTLSITPRGIRAKVLLREEDGVVSVDLAWSMTAGQRVFLILTPSPTIPTGENQRRKPEFPTYKVVGLVRSKSEVKPSQSAWKWKTVYIMEDRAIPSSRLVRNIANAVPERCTSYLEPFHIARQDLVELKITGSIRRHDPKIRSDFEPFEAVIERPSFHGPVQLTITPNLPYVVPGPSARAHREYRWYGDIECLAHRQPVKPSVQFVITLGRCSAGCQPKEYQHLPSSQSKGLHWAKIRSPKADDSVLDAGHFHACPSDHISSWPRMTRTFTFYPTKVPLVFLFTMSFTPTVINPDQLKLVLTSSVGIIQNPPESAAGHG
ncbi:heterokaryon incompatibility protein-domain-containing protein [Daedaleopsis nitida]|nr:heterokaryon incompatibility protein-domain-containing protein [Daedaleopsis nitida]